MDKIERMIVKLTQAQHADGSFGRFHTMDSKLKQKVPTTEAAAWLMYEYSITREYDICDNMCIYIERLLNDISLWPDSWEKNLFFKPSVPLFIASKLSLFGSYDETYKEICNLWVNLLIIAFETNEYNTKAVNEKSKNIFGIDIDGSYIGLHSINHIALYSANTKIIPPNIQNAYLKWLHNYNGVIGYTNIILKNTVKNSANIRLISLLSKFYGFANEFPQLT